MFAVLLASSLCRDERPSAVGGSGIVGSAADDRPVSHVLSVRTIKSDEHAADVVGGLVGANRLGLVPASNLRSDLSGVFFTVSM